MYLRYSKCSLTVVDCAQSAVKRNLITESIIIRIIFVFSVFCTMFNKTVLFGTCNITVHNVMLIKKIQTKADLAVSNVMFGKISTQKFMMNFHSNCNYFIYKPQKNSRCYETPRCETNTTEGLNTQKVPTTTWKNTKQNMNISR